MNLRALLLAALLAVTALPISSAGSTHDINDRFSFEEGQDNVQPGCTTMSLEFNPCHQIATSMNGLDTPKIDVLILVPASPTAERDMRIMRQSTEMWADGIDFLARDMNLTWLADGVEFHIFAEMINTGESEFTTYPIVDPEIVIIASNPVGGIGIGIDPIDFAGILFGEGAGEGPCHGVANPFDHSVWENLPGFDSHHNGRGGTYVEDCDGAGGNICFSVTAAIDPLGDGSPVPGAGIEFSLYDVVSHETGHCLTLGHVGDGAEGSWSSVPTNDIMAYHSDPPGKLKCVSTLDVEALVVPMSNYLDTNGDGVVNHRDRIYANDALGEFDGTGRPFQIQHPHDHYYASPSRAAIDCPQPDLSPVPLAEVVDFVPEVLPRETLDIDATYGTETPGVLQLVGHTNGTSGTSIQISVSRPPTPNATGEDLGMNQTVSVAADGTWSATVDLRDRNETVVVQAAWLNAEGEVVDSDRIHVLPTSDYPASTSPVNASQDEEAPTVAMPMLVLALAALAILRRR